MNNVTNLVEISAIISGMRLSLFVERVSSGLKRLSIDLSSLLDANNAHAEFISFMISSSTQFLKSMFFSICSALHRSSLLLCLGNDIVTGFFIWTTELSLAQYTWSSCSKITYFSMISQSGITRYWIWFHNTPEPLYNMVCYNTVLDNTTRIRVGPQMSIYNSFSYITMHFTLDITQFGFG